MPITRSDQSILGRWWWTVDHLTLGAIAILLIVGVLLIQAASPPVAMRIGQDGYYFVERHLFQLLLGIIMMIGLSLLSPSQIRNVAVVIFLISFALVVATHFWGVEIKGAKRWVHFPGLSIQPSEFMKPCFIILSARLFSRRLETQNFPGFWLGVALYIVTVSQLLLQPDMGMTILISIVWATQFFLAGMPFFIALGFIGLGASGILAAYFLFPHFSSRIDRFLNPDAGDNYQIQKSLEAFHNGGWLGVGPGEGQVKMAIPDAHADFIFSVAGEEFGLVSCVVIVALFAFIILRGFWRLRHENNFFIFLAVAGLLTEFGLQAVINMGSSLHLLPTKGMTLPFISYGGSSLLALSLSAGMLLSLTRKHYGQNT
ncbi:MAG: putative lipid II flippase FtsW [Alphaproteobacteria bacterium]|nr:putative lipid II flippase FtsW [Alphaproteobacteria bacterium]